MTTDIHGMFPRCYADARARFRTLAGANDGALVSYDHPLRGPNGESLASDVASWGPSDARDVLLIMSGTHGIEGFAGSGLQAVLLADGLPTNLPPNLRLLMVHAVNPHGFAWERRVNEDNVDLNRNFIDHTAPHPANPGYAELAAVLPPSQWNEGTPALVQAQLFEVIAQHDPAWFQSTMTRGQYSHPSGLFYGGSAATWSNRTMHAIADTFLASATRVLAIDVHTALGDYGAAECIVEHAPDSARHGAAHRIWGDRVRSTLSNDSVSAAVSGSCLSGLDRHLRGRVVGMGLEYGTTPVPQVLMAMIADQWLALHGDRDTAQGQAITAELRRVFYPDADPWRTAVVSIGRDVVRQAIDACRNET